MTTTTEIMPILSLAAANYVHEAGYWTEFNEMLDRAIEVVPNPRSIEVTLDKTACGTDPIILIFVDYYPEARYEQGNVDKSPAWCWDGWAAERYSGDVLRHFTMMAIPLPLEDSDEHGR